MVGSLEKPNHGDAWGEKLYEIFGIKEQTQQKSEYCLSASRPGMSQYNIITSSSLE